MFDEILLYQNAVLEYFVHILPTVVFDEQDEKF